MSARKSFSDYMAWALDEGLPCTVSPEINSEFVRRLSLEAQYIDCLPKLLRFAKDRWPTWWKRIYNASFHGPDQFENIEHACALIWADYLEWTELEE